MVDVLPDRKRRPAADAGILDRAELPIGQEDRRIAVLGLGYVGLPLALAFVEAGFDVRGVDTGDARVADLLMGQSPIDDIADERVQLALRAGFRVEHADEARLDGADVLIVCVPTPVTRSQDPDLGPVLTAARRIREALRPGQLVILQSTTFPGTTMGPFRSALEASGLRAGIDFELAYSPERVNPGDASTSGPVVPRIVGAMTAEGGRRAVRLLEQVSDRVVLVSSPDAAELAKILENTFRLVNISFVNQLALLCERLGLDAWEVIDAAATKPFGFMRFTPGPGAGGHCIPVDPRYLSWRAREFDFVDRFVELASEINVSMPRHVVSLVVDALNARGLPVRAARIGILGVAFKPNVRDARNSPAGAVMGGLRARGADIRFHDPHVARFRDDGGFEVVGHDVADLLAWADVVVALTKHEAIDWDRVYAGADLVVDAVGTSHGRTVRAGQVLKLGAGWSR